MSQTYPECQEEADYWQDHPPQDEPELTMTHPTLQKAIKEAEDRISEVYPNLYDLPPNCVRVYGVDSKGNKYIGRAVNPNDVKSFLSSELTKLWEVAVLQGYMEGREAQLKVCSHLHHKEIK